MDDPQRVKIPNAAQQVDEERKALRHGQSRNPFPRSPRQVIFEGALRSRHQDVCQVWEFLAREGRHDIPRLAQQVHHADLVLGLGLPGSHDLDHKRAIAVRRRQAHAVKDPAPGTLMHKSGADIGHHARPILRYHRIGELVDVMLRTRFLSMLSLTMPGQQGADLRPQPGKHVFLAPLGGHAGAATFGSGTDARVQARPIAGEASAAGMVHQARRRKRRNQL
mmetsp:Transcript_23731/g.68281  ORF Transcript_23731/g.68281 Transcript_23731/m.68281 type:complete len:222 (-) Transcript_23731:211-876(-)